LLAQYPSILKQAQEGQMQAEEAQAQELKKDFATKMKVLLV